MVQWYREVLGLRVLVRVIDDGYALVEAGDTRIALLARPIGGARLRGGSAWPSRSATCPRSAPAWKRPDRSISHPKRDQEGLREANTTDPDGNWIRLFSWPQRAVRRLAANRVGFDRADESTDASPGSTRRPARPEESARSPLPAKS